MIKKTMMLYPITPEQVIKAASGSTNIYKQHIMRALMNAGYATSVFCDLYGELFASGGSCAVDIPYPDVFEVIEQIHGAGGIAVMAHPAMYDGYELLEELCEKSLLDGIEVWNPKHTENDVRQFAEIAQTHGLLMTGGSDFHGMYTKEPTPLLACSTPDAQIRRLLEFKAEAR